MRSFKIDDIHVWNPLQGHGIKFVPREFGIREGPEPVLFLEQLPIIVWNLGRLALELTVSQRENILLGVLVVILDRQGLLVPFLRPHARDVNEHAGLGVYPSRVDRVHPVAPRAIHIGRIDLEQVISAPRRRHGRRAVAMQRHVVVAGQEVHVGQLDLDIDVRVPRHDLPVPEPPEQRPVHDPRLDPEIRHRAQVRLHCGAEVRALVRVRQLVVREAPVVVLVEERLVPVFLRRLVRFAAGVVGQRYSDAGEVGVAPHQSASQGTQEEHGEGDGVAEARHHLVQDVICKRKLRYCVDI